jgi:two-component system nitrate/nitrite response regulator NarL
VLVVGEDALARSGLAALFAGDPSIEVVGQLDPAAALATAPSPLPPHDVAVWDLGLHPSSALERLRELAGGEGFESHPPEGAEGVEETEELEEQVGAPVLALVAGEAVAAEALAAGARGLLFRDAEPFRLKAALAALAQGLLVIDEALAPRLLRQRPATPALAEPLTPRELEVLDLLAQGLSNKQIAGRLAISEHTAKFHVNAIVGKLGAQSRTDAAVRAARLGLFVL